MMMQTYLTENFPLLPTQQEMSEVDFEAEQMEQVIAEAREHMDAQEDDPWLIEITV